jgi:predicted transcriptional regulator of viral defense system
MEFSRLLEIIGSEPVFETSLLLAGDVNPANVRRQLSRWVGAGWLYQLRRGVYALAPPYQKVKPHPFVVANALVRNSYVSLQSALAHHGLIPEYTPVVTSVTTARPGRWETPLGDFSSRHVKAAWFHSYQRLVLGGDQRAFVAAPEKALLDLIYLEPGGDRPEYLAELRLQALERLDLDMLTRLADQSGKPKLGRAARQVVDLAGIEIAGYETLCPT